MRWILTVATSALVWAALPGSSLADATNFDPAGDVIATSPEIAALTPDLTTIAVSNTPDGRITFSLTIASPPTLDPASVFAIFLDLDKSDLTGDDGDDAQAFFTASGEVDFERWNGSEMIDVPETGMTANLAAGVLSYTVERRELGDVTSFEFDVGALVLKEGRVGVDVAPNTGHYAYDVVGLAASSLSATKPAGTPARPRAGKRFTVSSVVTRDDTGELVSSGTVICSVRAGTARVRASGGFGVAGARCAMTVPRNARGKTLRGTITIQAAGATVKRSFVFRIT